VKRLLAELDECGDLKKLQVEGGLSPAVAQAGVDDPATVREQVTEQRKLQPGEVDDLVARYRAGASQSELAKRSGVHRQTVYRYLMKRGIPLRPQVTPTEQQELEAVRLYVEQNQTLVEVAQKLDVSPSTVRNVLLRRGVERRAQARRSRHRGDAT
jgi:predicted DNA-binding protein (UPF0251 family)